MSIGSTERSRQAGQAASGRRRDALARLALGILCNSWLVVLAGAPASAQSLVSLEYRLTGAQLRVTPAVLSVPKGIAGSVLVEIGSPNSTNVVRDSALASGSFVEATLRGPSFPARRVIGSVNAPLLLPQLPVVGDYQLDNIRLVDAASGETRLEGNPASVP